MAINFYLTSLSTNSSRVYMENYNGLWSSNNWYSIKFQLIPFGALALLITSHPFVFGCAVLAFTAVRTIFYVDKPKETDGPWSCSHFHVQTAKFGANYFRLFVWTAIIVQNWSPELGQFANPV